MCQLVQEQSVTKPVKRQGLSEVDNVVWSWCQATVQAEQGGHWTGPATEQRNCLGLRGGPHQHPPGQSVFGLQRVAALHCTVVRTQETVAQVATVLSGLGQELLFSGHSFISLTWHWVSESKGRQSRPGRARQRSGQVRPNFARLDLDHLISMEESWRAGAWSQQEQAVTCSQRAANHPWYSQCLRSTVTLFRSGFQDWPWQQPRRGVTVRVVLVRVEIEQEVEEVISGRETTNEIRENKINIARNTRNERTNE